MIPTSPKTSSATLESAAVLLLFRDSAFHKPCPVRVEPLHSAGIPRARPAAPGQAYKVAGVRVLALRQGRAREQAYREMAAWVSSVALAFGQSVAPAIAAVVRAWKQSAVPVRLAGSPQGKFFGDVVISPLGPAPAICLSPECSRKAEARSRSIIRSIQKTNICFTPSSSRRT